MSNKIEREALTFDDVLLIPQASDVALAEIDMRTKLTRTITLNIPILSAAMDTVTESELAIAVAAEGGIGIIHKNMPPEQQALEVDRVKRFESGMITNPITLKPTDTIATAHENMRRYGISGFPVTLGNELKGIVTSRDLRFAADYTKTIETIMTPAPRLVTVLEGTTMEEAKRKLHEHRIEKIQIGRASCRERV